jgi:hypothetical protein
MLRRSLGGLLLVGLCGVMAAGCVVYEKRELLRTDEPKRLARFESDAAASLFDFGFARRLKNQDQAQSETVCILLAKWTWTAAVAEAAYYNDEIVACDTNHDGVISEAEALAYHRRIAPPRDRRGEQAEATLLREVAQRVHGGPPVPATLPVVFLGMPVSGP